jgi:uncharacterized SAM-binding protein YcdF (DUF218 family)
MRRFWVVSSVVVLGVVVAYAARRPLLVAAGNFLILRQAPHAADAIVVLSGSLPDRILAAVDLYQGGFAPRIILTREAPLPGIEALRARGGYLPEHHEQNRQIAEQLGVPAAVIDVIPSLATSTFAEAQALVSYLRAENIHSILLVTSNAHSRRAAWIFGFLADGNPRISVWPSPYDPFSATDWWQHRGLVRRLIIEYGKLLTFLLVDRWRGAAAEPRATPMATPAPVASDNPSRMHDSR